VGGSFFSGLVFQVHIGAEAIRAEVLVGAKVGGVDAAIPRLAAANERKTNLGRVGIESTVQNGCATD
jgi:hypothetical protein